MSTTVIAPTIRELDQRESDGILVTLRWDESNGKTTVVVEDSRTNETFFVSVREGQNAMDVFHHPYAYR